MSNRIGKAYLENNPPTVTFDEPNGAAFFLCPDETVLPPYNNPCPQIEAAVSETPVEYNDCVTCDAITQALIVNYIENGPFPSTFTLNIPGVFEKYLTSLSALQNLCNFTFQVDGNNAPTIDFAEENGAAYYLCPNETVLPPFTAEITAVSGCLPCNFITTTLQAYYLENGSNAAPPNLNALYGVSPELAELNIDFSSYSSICGFTVDFEDQFTAIFTWTNPTPSTSYFCLGTYTTAPDAGNLAHRYGFNGQERSDEIYGKGNLNTALFWEYDTRLGRRWNLDPIDQISISNYAVMSLNPILFQDFNGDNATKYEDETGNLLLKTNDGNDNRTVTVKNEDRSKFDIYVNVGKEKGVIDNEGYNNWMVNRLSENSNASILEISLAGVGTAAAAGEKLADNVIKSRSGFTSGKISPNSPFVFSKDAAKNIKMGAKFVGTGLTGWSILSTESDYDAGNITNARRVDNHLKNGVGLIFPMTAIPIAAGNYLGTKYAPQISNSIEKPGGFFHEFTKFMLNLGGIPTEAPEEPPTKK